MMVFNFLEMDPALSEGFDQGYVDARANLLGEETIELWQSIKDAARREAKKIQS